jgi:hypothetical protein
MVKLNMKRKPIDEYHLLAALPGFNSLTNDEISRMTVAEFKYENYSCIMTTGLHFEYQDVLGRKTKLTFEMTGIPQEDRLYSHVLYEGAIEEVEFPDFRKAIDFCDQRDRSAPDWEELSTLVNKVVFKN